MESEEELTSLGGVKFRETIVTEVSKVTPFRHFAIPPSGHHDEAPLGPLALFSFVAPARTEPPARDHGETVRQSLAHHFTTGAFLDSKEKGVMFPVVHFTNDRDSLKKRLSDEHVLDNDYILYQGVYREVRSIRPEGVVQSNGHGTNPKTTAYILIGFKSLDKNFSQEVMVDSWKDWTGARHIYMDLPDELGLSRISFYHREAPLSLNMFLYVVLVECTTVTTMEDQIKLLDFTQRLRAERLTGYISVYGVSPA